ncbi:MAG: hypothetical protein IPL72_06365 [Sulfuritalea sp.]|nr:hypothetical protein [Sulfuritalea sp.]
MNLNDLGAVMMGSLAQEVMSKVERHITDQDWRAIEEGAIGFGFSATVRGCCVEADCWLDRDEGREQIFTVSRTLAPAALG